MILIQTPWTPSKACDDLSATIRQALGTLVDPRNALVLLPHADGGTAEAVAESTAVQQLGNLSKSLGIYLAGSAYVKTTDEQTQTIGFLIGPDGDALLRTPKILPDLVEGFTDSVAETFQPAEFQVAMTPEGQVGILCGEDVLSPHIVRALVTSGAEVLLNPTRERTDSTFDIRQKARQARSYENLAYVATASASSVTIDGVTAKLPSATALAEMWGTDLRVTGDESFVVGDIDIQALRRRRQEPMGNLPAIARMRVYAEGYANEASKSPLCPDTRTDWIAKGQDKVRASAASRSDHADRMDRYDVVLGQTVTQVALKPDTLMEYRQRNLENALYVVRPFAMSPGVKLVVFPEFFLTGAVSQLGSSSGGIADKIGITFPGPEADQLAKFAQDHNTYVAGGVFEYDLAWPNRFFNSAFIFDDNGKLIHLYRKIHCADVFGRLPDTTPGSVYTEYVDRYGYDHLFPVADTPLGKLCTVICFDMNFGETHRAMIKRGAEVIIHPTSEPHNIRRRGWDLARHARAYENTAYLLTAGHGGEFRGEGLGFPGAMQRGYSKVVNFDGSLQCIVDGPGAVPLAGSLDLTALRRARADIKTNLAAWDDPAVYAHQYAAERGLPNNAWAGDPLVNPYVDASEIKKVIDIYQRDGVYVPPDGASAKPAIDQSMQAVV